MFEINRSVDEEKSDVIYVELSITLHVVSHRIFVMALGYEGLGGLATRWV